MGTGGPADGLQEGGEGGVGVVGGPGELEGELVAGDGDVADAVQGDCLVGGSYDGYSEACCYKA